MARKNGIRLITVPCWWNGALDSLVNTINFHCPDLDLQTNLKSNLNSNPITLNPPLDFFKGIYNH